MRDQQAETNIEVVSKTLRAIAEGDIDAALGQFERDGKWNVAQGLPEAGVYDGPDAIRKMLAAVRERLHGGYKLQNLSVHGTHDHAFAEYTRSRTDDSYGPGSEHCLVVFDMVMGKIREARDFVHRKS